MARGSGNIIEQHVEKVALGLAGVFLVLMLYMYLVRTPNRVDYGGQKVTPAGLAEAIQRDTETLQKAMRGAPAVDTQVPDYSAQLVEIHSAGIFAAKSEGEPLVPAALPLAAEFGQPVPNLSEEHEEGHSNVTLVPPLAPSPPVLRTGRNLVIRARPSLTPTSVAGEDADGEGPAEVAWVSAAAYFDKAAQQSAMTNAGYATYLSKIYIAGLDVQRQEVLADGRYSEWQDVRSTAIPHVEIPAPEFDSVSNTIVNRDGINQAFAAVKAYQQQICQPAFYKTEAGEEWKMPPLEGYPDAGAEAKVREPRGSRESQEGGRGSGPKVLTPSEEKQNRERAEEDLAKAEDAYRKGQDDQALRAASSVLENPQARGNLRNKARAIVQSIELLQKQLRAKVAAAPVQTPTGEGALPDPSAPTKPGGGATDAAKEPSLVMHPKNSEKLAVWYHDDTVESGKSYRYRMRVKLWNRYVTKFSALKDPEQGKQAVLLGDWSLPSEPVTVAPAAYFFLTSAPPGKDLATVTVYKWHKGARVKQTFNVGIGDLIGQVQESDTGILDRQTLQPAREAVDYSTGALVLDLRFEQPVVQRTVSDKGKGEFSLRDAESAVLVYLDPADGQVKQRVERFDRYDPTLRALREAEE